MKREAEQRSETLKKQKTVFLGNFLKGGVKNKMMETLGKVRNKKEEEKKK